ncbi:TetR/AcrR family transcriptional regulator [Phenylobacterium kunshanense]|uniref:TetR/AcrR family transcriptional regulator n=1 Tax=Phenylobacterium kunshanense TaxID=1445034 RepID=A0A328BAF5_9CAUL|nr:TetR/AcrR family transcriptional regulator [Phenylobacterium kunshanense]
MGQAMRRTQAERSDESERRLLDATARVVAEHGVSAATFDAIGRSAGYSRGLATQKFGSKQGLIEALISDLHDQQEAKLAAYHLDQRPGLEAVLEYVDLYLRHLGDSPASRAYFMLLAGSVADASDLRAAFERSHERVKARLVSLIRRGQAGGGLRPELDADSAALMVGSLLLGVSVQWLVDPQVDLDAIRRTSLQTLKLALAAPAGK